MGGDMLAMCAALSEPLRHCAAYHSTSQAVPSRPNSASVVLGGSCSAPTSTSLPSHLTAAGIHSVAGSVANQLSFAHPAALLLPGPQACCCCISSA
jgi:hypothetical protein